MSEPLLAPLTGLRGIEHVGLTVPDMDQALTFFREVFGAEILYELGPLQAADNWMTVNLGVEPDTVIRRLAMMRIASGPCVELFEFEHDPAERHPPKANEIGAQHLALYVDDIDACVASLRAHGLIVLGEPKRPGDGPQNGLAWVHFLSPWGQQFELVSYPSGVHAYANRDPAVWRPGEEQDIEDVDD